MMEDLRPCHNNPHADPLRSLTRDEEVEGVRGRVFRPSGDHGTAMLLVLVVLTVFLVLSSVVAALSMQQRRHLVGATHEAQARYAAEAVVNVALRRLETDPWWRTDGEPISVREGIEARVSVETYGGFYRIEARSMVRDRDYALRATVGASHPLDAYAVVVGDTETPFHVAGATFISGDLLVGPRGVQRGMIGGRPFRGRIQGTVTTDVNPLPAFDASLIESELAGLDELIENPPRAAGRIEDGLPFPNSNYLYAEGNLTLTGVESEHWTEPITVLTQHDLRLGEGFRAPDGSRFAARGSIRLGADVANHVGLVYAGRSLTVEAGARTSGQLFGRDSVRVENGSYLLYPTLVAVTGRVVGTERHGSIVIAGGATIDGTLLYPSPAAAVPNERGRVVIEPGGVVRGAIYSAGQTELRGTAHGSVFTHRFFHFASPRALVNWLVDATVRRDDRPDPFLLPVGLEGGTRLDVMRWERLDIGDSSASEYPSEP